MFKNALSVKSGKTVSVCCKVSRYPVQNDSHPCFVQFIDQIHKIPGRTISGSRCVVARYLITPGTVIRMLRNTHQLNVSILHFLQVFYNSVSKLTIIVKSLLCTVRMFHKGTNVTFINGHRSAVNILTVTLFHPLLIRPAKTTHISNNRSSSRSVFGLICKGIRLVKLIALPGKNQEFVYIPDSGLGNK